MYNTDIDLISVNMIKINLLFDEIFSIDELIRVCMRGCTIYFELK